MNPLAAFFTELNLKSIPYCAVGNTAELPAIPSNDVDLVVSNQGFSSLMETITFVAVRHGGKVVQILQHESNAFYNVLWFPRQGEIGLFLKLDICTDYIRDGRVFLSADWLLEDRIRGGNLNEPQQFFVAQPLREFSYYLMKRIDKGLASASALAHLSTLLEKEPSRCRQFLMQYWPGDVALIEEVISAQDWSRFGLISGRLKKQLARALPAPSLALRLAEVTRRIKRVLRPTGFVIAILGPDGSGKSTLISNLVPRLSPLGRHDLYFHLLPRVPLFRRIRNLAPTTDPHAEAPRGALGSALKLLYFVWVYNVGWIWSIWLPRRRSNMIYFDRYYHDILADPLRYRNGVPRWLSKLLGHVIPQPDLVLILDVNPQIVRSRKTEVSETESVRQHFAYRKLALEISRAVLIDANGSPESVAAACERAVVNAMARRLEKRK